MGSDRNVTPGKTTNIPAVKKSRPVPFWTSWRFIQSLLCCFGLANMMALRTNLNFVIICMVNHTAFSTGLEEIIIANISNDSYVTPGDGCLLKSAHQSDTENGDFLWDKSRQGVILASLFWGYLVFLIPAGILCTKFGAKRTFGVSMLVAALATLLVPIAARTGYVFLIITRVLVGLSAGVSLPAFNYILGKWVPPAERTRLASLSISGNFIGTIFMYPLAGYLCKYGFAGGWPSIFYLQGCIALLWLALWAAFVTDDPAEHKFVSRSELTYIKRALCHNTAPIETKRKVPWRSILTSGPVLGFCLACMAADWGGYMMQTGLPLYMMEVLKFDIRSNGLFSSLPYMALFVMTLGAGHLSDGLTNSVLSTKNTRKLLMSLGLILPSLFLIGMGHLECDQRILAVSLLTVGVGLFSLHVACTSVNGVDIASGFAPIVYAFANASGCISGIINPILTNYITRDKTREQWLIVFYITAAVRGVGGIMYLLLGDGEVQSWAKGTAPRNELMVETQESSKRHPAELEQQSFI